MRAFPPVKRKCGQIDLFLVFDRMSSNSCLVVRNVINVAPHERPAKKVMTVPDAREGSMKTPRQLLDELFDRVRSQNPSLGTSIAAEAKFLHMSVGHLSRIKNQRVAMTDDLIDRIVDRFIPDPTANARRQSLRRELTLSREAAAISSPTSTPNEIHVSKGAVKDFFARYGGPGTLLCCEYRDRPQINEVRGAFPSIGQDAARAVAAGLAYAFFQPYGRADRIAAAITECVKRDEDPVGLRYLLDVAIEVRNAFMKVKDLAMKLNPNIQMALYEADNEKIEVSGIQARLFYVNFPGSGTKEREQKIYQWIAGTDNHYFIERDKESVGPGAIAHQFIPITAYWTEHSKLPATEDELRQTQCEDTIKWSIWASGAQRAGQK